MLSNSAASCHRTFECVAVAIWCLLLTVCPSALANNVHVANDYYSSAYVLYQFPNESSPSLVVQPASSPPPENYIPVVTAISNMSYDDLGWDFLQISPAPSLFNNESDSDAAYFYSGYLEGYLTFARIYNSSSAFNFTASPKARQWVRDHVEYMQSNVANNAATGFASDFWTQVGFIMSQLAGIADGYNQGVTDSQGSSSSTSGSNASSSSGSGPYPHLSFLDIFSLNFAEEIFDVETAVANGTSQTETTRRREADDQHCSAIVKVTPDDVLFSHVTWSGYNVMLRQYKVYEFQVTVSMSGYPGQIASGDDWYMTSNKLASMETTNGYYNNTLAEQYVRPHTVSEFIRVMTANYVANSGAEWAELFAYNNSGTYCNQYMVLDYKKFHAGDVGAALQSGLLWVAEQMPGNVTAADVTQVLRDKSYWASFNIPYFQNIFNNSGFAYLEEQYGAFFSYTKYARPEIFRRNQSAVVDVESLKALMRYNDWQHDPLSAIPICTTCSGVFEPTQSPALVIAKRGDLVPKYTKVPDNATYANFFVNPILRGAIDAKIVSGKLWNNSMQGVVICGPTSDQQPVFTFDQYPGQRPPGAANRYDFPWTAFNVVDMSTLGQTSDKDKITLIVGLSVAIPLTILMLALVVWRVRHNRQKLEAAAVYCERRPSEKIALLV